MRFFLTIAVVLFAGCAEESNHRKGGKAKEFDLNLTWLTTDAESLVKMI